MLQEYGYLAVVFQEADNGFVQSREGFVTLVLAGVVHSAAVKDETSSVARGIFGDTFFVGKAGDFHHEATLLQVVCKLFQIGEFAQNPAEVGIFWIRFLEQLAKVLDGEGDTLYEVGLLLEVTAETIGTQHLHGAEQYEVAKLGIEISLVHGLVLAQGVDVFLQQLLAQAVGIVCFGLPQEGGNVVVDRTFASALEVDEPRLAVLYHNVTALEVAVHEGGGAATEQHVCHLLEVVLQPVFLKVHPRSLEEAVFKVVQVPQNAAAVELCLRVAVGEVHAVGSGKLHGGQQTDGLAQ